MIDELLLYLVLAGALMAAGVGGLLAGLRLAPAPAVAGGLAPDWPAPQPQPAPPPVADVPDVLVGEPAIGRAPAPAGAAATLPTPAAVPAEIVVAGSELPPRLGITLTDLHLPELAEPTVQLPVVHPEPGHRVVWAGPEHRYRYPWPDMARAGWRKGVYRLLGIRARHVRRAGVGPARGQLAVRLRLSPDWRNQLAVPAGAGTWGWPR